MDYNQFITNAEDKKVLDTVKKELKECEEFYIAVAFITSSGVEVLSSILDDLYKEGKKGKILTGDYLAFTDPSAIKELQKYTNLQVRLVSENGFHAKGYLFVHKTQISLLIGSSNLTRAALLSNTEWNIYSKGISSELKSKFKQEFNQSWEKAGELSESKLNNYMKKYESRVKLYSSVSASNNGMDKTEELVYDASLEEEISLILSDSKNN